VIKNHWKFKMAEGALVSVQHRLTAARVLATHVRDSCAGACHLTATLPHERKPRVSIEVGLTSAPLELGKNYSFTSPTHPMPLRSASSPSSAPHR
jgi:hypothetical protein